jgi:hypothetical protein
MNGLLAVQQKFELVPIGYGFDTKREPDRRSPAIILMILSRLSCHAESKSVFPQ